MTSHFVTFCSQGTRWYQEVFFFFGKTGLENNEPAQHEPTEAWKLEMRACD